MPLKRCTKNGKSGWKYGDSGYCYIGPGARKKAIKQMKAIKVNSSRLNVLLNSIQNTIDPPKSE